MTNWSKQTGWAKHSIFGLRKEWLDHYISCPDTWQIGSLGNRQVDSLAMWLKTAGIVDSSGSLTRFGRQFRSAGTNCTSFWEVLWGNVVFSFPTAHWYVRLGLGTWTTKGLRILLERSVPRLAQRTVSNAIMELVGLLERTPVGTQLGQGQVTRDKPRKVTRVGNDPSDIAIAQCVLNLHAQQGKRELHWSDDLTWPWIVYGSTKRYILSRLVSMECDYFDITEQGTLAK